MPSRLRISAVLLLPLLAAPACAHSQVIQSLGSSVVAAADSAQHDAVRSAASAAAAATTNFRAPEPLDVPFASRRDSLEWVAARNRADGASGFRIVVSLRDRQLWVIDGEDTLRTAPVAVGKGTTLDYKGKTWTFKTPRGVRKVLGKESDPVWIPPEWHYAEVAEEHGFKLAHLSATRPTHVDDSTTLVVRDQLVGTLGADSVFTPLPTDEEIIFGNTLYVPPLGTKNREIDGELGRYRLMLGDGYLLHGTPHEESIGRAATHGCVRLLDDDIEWLYYNVPVGTKVYLY